MNYRTLGRTGIRISEVSLGGWLTYGNTVEKSVTRDVTRRALELGINHIDTADVYAQGECEKALGEVLEGVRRASYVLASKVFWPTGPGPNDKGLSRKHIHETIDISLKRLRTDYLDIFYCHRHDPETPLEETVAAMEDLVSRGKILAWGVSCWTSDQIRAACRLAGRHKPVVNQPPYNVFARQIEKDVLATCAAEGLGVAVWSPLAQGVLTGKYLHERPPGSRALNEKVNKFMQKYFTPDMQRVVERLVAIARDACLTPSQLALGWCLRRAELTCVIVGATHVGQLEETAKAAALPAGVLDAVEKVVKDAPQVEAV
jgi:aryl-alcohol dehydrogenase-like predicted oxidoreductase